MVVALLAPGQGAQKPGFLAPWLDLPHAAERLAWWSRLAGVDLRRLGTEADAEEIKDTAKTQPLLAAAALLTAAELPVSDVAVVAGHSVGELPAAAIAGALSPENAVALAALRGKEMAAACAAADTGMSAVLGGERDEVLARLADLDLVAANENGARQIVAAGPVEALAKLRENPPATARVVALAVAGAFHTAYMAPAELALARVVPGITVSDPQRILLSNADGTSVASGVELRQRLVAQVTRPVRWDLCQSTLADLGVTAVIELAPAGTLAGLAKRTLKNVEIVTVNTPDDLASARAAIAHHGGHPTGEPAVQFQLATAGAAGTFSPAELAEGASVAPGAVVGHVQTRQGPVEITTGAGGHLAEWLAHDGDPIAAGQPVARIHADAVLAHLVEGSHA